MNLKEAEEKLIFKCTGGSHAYGTATPESDTDTRGVFMMPASFYLQVKNNVEQVSDAKNDRVYYTLKRFLDLASEANPNILELLFMPQDCIQLIQPEFEEVLTNRHLFISKLIIQKYVGYAVAQIKKAEGQNKLINNPQPEAKPTKEDFCWIIPFNTEEQDCSEYDYEVFQRHRREQMPCRPINIKKLKPSSQVFYNLANFHCSALEHAHHVYRLYYYGEAAKGVFRGKGDEEMLVCEPIPFDDESTSFSGLLIYNQDAYEKSLKDWKQYWNWKEHRNEARWRDQEGRENPVDFKNMAHCIRLLYEGENILNDGAPVVRFTGEKLERLRAIRRGEIPYADLLAEAEERVTKLDDLRRTSSLPNTADLKAISELSIRLHTF